MKPLHNLQTASDCRARLPSHQRGMGATAILFTIALIILVGAALAYASRGNPNAINTQSAKIQAALVLKQGGDYRDAYSRYISEGGVAGSMTWDTASTGLFNSTTQYGIYMAPPVQAMALNSGTYATAQWRYNKAIDLANVGTSSNDSIAYIPDVALTVCEEINNQLYGTKSIPPSGSVAFSAVTDTLAALDAAATGGAAGTPGAGKAVGCFKTSDAKYVAYTALAEN